MAATIPPFSLARQTEALAPELQPALLRVLASGRFAQGPECEALERELAAFLNGLQTAAGAPALQAAVCASGTDALHLALRALDARPGDVVLTTAFTFFATAGAILLAGLRPEFVDIDPASFNLAPAALARALERKRSRRVAAILPVHLYGRLADMPRILALASAHSVPVVEDAAQAIGATLEGRAAGAWGALAAFSFYPTKNLGAAGEGGLVTTVDEALDRRVRLLRVHGSPRRYEHEMLGWNARMHELQAAVLRVKLPHLAEWNRRRAAIAAGYEARLLAHPAVRAGVTVPERVPGHVFHQYVLRVKEREALRPFLLERGVATEVYYPIPLHRQPALREFAPEPGALPESERAAAEALALPMFPELTEAEMDRVTSAISAFYATRPAVAGARS